MEPSPPNLTHDWTTGGRTLRYTWLGDVEVTPSRVYAFAFTPDGHLLLVAGAAADALWWLPGGGVEPGETAMEALERELAEEAAATLHVCRRIGAQRVDDPVSGSEFHDFYWCRVWLSDSFVPEHEVTRRQTVPPDAFLDILFWGRTDPKAPLLLERALELEALAGPWPPAL